MPFRSIILDTLESAECVCIRLGCIHRGGRNFFEPVLLLNDRTAVMVHFCNCKRLSKYGDTHSNALTDLRAGLDEEIIHSAYK